METDRSYKSLFKAHIRFTIEKISLKHLTVQHPVAKDILKQNEMCTVYLFDLQNFKFVRLIIIWSKPKLKLNLTYIIRSIALESTLVLDVPIISFVLKVFFLYIHQPKRSKGLSTEL